MQQKTPWIVGGLAILGGLATVVGAASVLWTMTAPPPQVLAVEAVPASDAEIGAAQPTLAETTPPTPESPAQPSLANVPPDALTVAAMQPVQNRLAYYPKPMPGDWRMYDVYEGDGAMMTPSRVVVRRWVYQNGMSRQDQLLLNLDGRLETESSRTVDLSEDRFALREMKTAGQPTVVLDPFEVLMAPEELTFSSMLSGATVSVRALQVQEATVPAGTFECLRVQRAWPQGGQVTEDTWWNTMGMIAQQSTSTNPPQERLWVLSGVGNEPNPQALVPAVERRKRELGL